MVSGGSLPLRRTEPALRCGLPGVDLHAQAAGSGIMVKVVRMAIVRMAIVRVVRMLHGVELDPIPPVPDLPGPAALQHRAFAPGRATLAPWFEWRRLWR